MAVRVLRTFKAILTEAQRLGTIAFNPAASVKLKRAARTQTRMIVPTPTQLSTLIRAASTGCSISAPAVLSVLVFTGVRASELRGLAWSDIDFVAQHIRISRRADEREILEPPKSRAGNRAIPVSTFTLNALKAWKLLCPKSTNDLVFPSTCGSVMSYARMREIVDQVARAAGLCDVVGEDRPAKARFGLHAFRHAAASLWIEQGENPKRIQSMMGHSSIQVTFDTYGHLFQDASRDAATADAMTRAVLAAT